MNEKLKRLLLEHEGLELEPYRCTSGRVTIGIGRNIQDNPLTPEEIQYLGRANIAETGITEDEAWYLLESDIRKVETALARALPWFAKLDEVRRAALIDMGFMGVGKLRTFKKMLAAFERGDFGAAAVEARDSKWARDVKANRTNDICLMIEHGRWPEGI